MADGNNPSHKGLKRFGRWGTVVVLVGATIAVLADIDGTISLTERVGHRVGLGDSPDSAGGGPAPSEPTLPDSPTSQPTTGPSITETTPTDEPSTTAPATPDEQSTPDPSVVVDTTEPPSTPTPAPNAFGWYYLADLHPVSTVLGQNCTGGCTGFQSGPGSLGQVYPQSYVMRVSRRGSLSVSVWNALRACTTFDAMVGLDDMSDSTEARFTITPDGSSPVTVATVRTGQPKHVTFNLKNVYRFTLATNLTKPEANEQKTVWGDAKVYCTSNIKPSDG